MYGECPAHGHAPVIFGSAIIIVTKIEHVHDMSIYTYVHVRTVHTGMTVYLEKMNLIAVRGRTQCYT